MHRNQLDNLYNLSALGGAQVLNQLAVRAEVLDVGTVVDDLLVRLELLVVGTVERGEA